MTSCAASFLVATSVASAQITELIDGTGDGAGNPLDTASAIAVDGSANMYVAGFWTSNVFAVAPDGRITEIIDATGDGSGNTLDQPAALAVGLSGNVYVSGGDLFGSAAGQAFRIAPDGTVEQIIGADGDSAGNTLGFSAGITVDASENVYVSGSLSHNVFRITPGGAITAILDQTGDGLGNEVDLPTAIAVDGVGNVYVACALSDNAFRITPAGLAIEIIDGAGDRMGHVLDQPAGIAVDRRGVAYVTGFRSHNAFRIHPRLGAPGGGVEQVIDIDGDGTSPLYGPEGIAVDGWGDVYVAGRNSWNAFRITR